MTQHQSELQQLRQDVAALRQQNEQIFGLLQQVLDRHGAPAANEPALQSPAKCYELLGHKSKRALYDAVYRGDYQPGTEYTRNGNRLLMNVPVILRRRERATRRTG